MLKRINVTKFAIFFAVLLGGVQFCYGYSCGNEAKEQGLPRYGLQSTCLNLVINNNLSNSNINHRIKVVPNGIERCMNYDRGSAEKSIAPGTYNQIGFHVDVGVLRNCFNSQSPNKYRSFDLWTIKNTGGLDQYIGRIFVRAQSYGAGSSNIPFNTSWRVSVHRHGATYDAVANSNTTSFANDPGTITVTVNHKK